MPERIEIGDPNALDEGDGRLLVFWASVRGDWEARWRLSSRSLFDALSRTQPDGSLALDDRTLALSIQAKNYQPTQADWEKGEGGEYTAWYEMRWALTAPMRFGYCYEGVGEGMESEFTVWAFGDLDGDGVLSTYRRVGAVGPDGAPMVGPVVAVRDGE
jgi:hypothetical protein